MTGNVVFTQVAPAEDGVMNELPYLHRKRSAIYERGISLLGINFIFCGFESLSAFMLHSKVTVHFLQ